MPSSGRVDGAVIATPNHTHRDLALRCLSASIPVLIEKPLATTVGAGLEIVEAAEKNAAGPRGRILFPFPARISSS